MSVQNEATDQRQAAVYRLYAADDTLLYIGSSYNPERRCRDHYAKQWWPLVARRSEEWFPSKEAAYSAEMAAIAAEIPPHNEMGTPRYIPPSVKAAAQRAHRSGELTVKEIMSKHGISRQSLHTYRQRPDFPGPVSRPGTGGLRWRDDEVTAWFAANPPQPGKRTDLAPEPEQGEPVTTTVDPRIAILSDLNDPPYNDVAEKRCVPWDAAEKLVDAYRAKELRLAAEAIEQEFLRGLTDSERDEIWNDAIKAAATVLRRMASEPEASDG